MLHRIFLEVFNTSIRAALLIGCVLILRAFLKKRSHRAMTLLWLLVAVRLLIPLTVKISGVRIPSKIVSSENASSTEQIPTEPPEDQPAMTGDGQPGQVLAVETTSGVDVFSVSALIWGAGVLTILAYNGLSFMRLRAKLAESISDGELMICDRIGIPFVFGLFRPRIYLPSDMKPEYRTSVIAHEKMHIRRWDNWKKLLYICVVTLHWFNPLVWVAYYAADRDCEMACDADVTREMSNEEKKEYIMSVLFFSGYPRGKMPYATGFSNGCVKERLNNIMAPKQQRKTVFAACMFIGVILFMISIAAAKETDPAENDPVLRMLRESHPQYFELATEQGLTVFVTEWTEGSYRCGVMAGQDLHPAQAELTEISLGGVDLESVKLILSTYEIGEDRIAVVPFANALSSYSGKTSTAPTDPETIAMVRELVFGK